MQHNYPADARLDATASLLPPFIWQLIISAACVLALAASLPARASDVLLLRDRAGERELRGTVTQLLTYGDSGIVEFVGIEAAASDTLFTDGFDAGGAHLNWHLLIHTPSGADDRLVQCVSSIDYHTGAGEGLLVELQCVQP